MRSLPVAMCNLQVAHYINRDRKMCNPMVANQDRLVFAWQCAKRAGGSGSAAGGGGVPRRLGGGEMWKRQARGVVKRVGIFLLLFTQSGHAANAPETFKCSARGGAEWREYRSKHFLVATDIPKDAAAMLIKNLERIHTMVMHAMVGEEVDLPARTRVTAFGDSGQFKEVARGYGGYHTISPSKEARIVIPVLRLNGDPEGVAPELVHHLSWYLFARQPRWFSEGLAQFIQTVASDRIDNETHLATGTHIVRGDTHQQGGVGVIPHDFNYEFQETPPVKVKELLSWA